MYSPNKIQSLRRAAETAVAQANQLIARGDYVRAEQICREALKQWRNGGGQKLEESKLVAILGKCLEAQQKYELAYELYMEVLPNLKGEAYDDIYTSLLYLTERMGTFTKKEKVDDQNPWY